MARNLKRMHLMHMLFIILNRGKNIVTKKQINNTTVVYIPGQEYSVTMSTGKYQ